MSIGNRIQRDRRAPGLGDQSRLTDGSECHTAGWLRARPRAALREKREGWADWMLRSEGGGTSRVDRGGPGRDQKRRLAIGLETRLEELSDGITHLSVGPTDNDTSRQKHGPKLARSRSLRHVGGKATKKSCRKRLHCSWSSVKRGEEITLDRDPRSNPNGSLWHWQSSFEHGPASEMQVSYHVTERDNELLIRPKLLPDDLRKRSHYSSGHQR